MTDRDKLSTEPNRASDYDRKDEQDTVREQTAEGERQADASVGDRHKESSKLLKSLPPTESACPTNLCVSQRGNIVNVKNGFPFLPIVSIMDIPVKPICTNNSLV